MMTDAFFAKFSVEYVYWGQVQGKNAGRVTSSAVVRV